MLSWSPPPAYLLRLLARTDLHIGLMHSAVLTLMLNDRWITIDGVHYG